MVEKKKARKAAPKKSIKEKDDVAAPFPFMLQENFQDEPAFTMDTKSELLEFAELDRERHSRGFFTVLIVSVALISGLIAFGLAQQIRPTLGEQTTLAAKTSGGVCLTEKELKNLVSEQKLTAYWSGPIGGATYSINANQSGQVFIRYIEKGQKCDSQTREYRVIATYSQAGAFESTKAAGNQANGVSLANTDGSIVYFNKESPTNVYLAYPEIEYQIEIFDPDPKKAVTLATTPNQIQLIKG
jgi:hypothetical protein